MQPWHYPLVSTGPTCTSSVFSLRQIYMARIDAPIYVLTGYFNALNRQRRQHSRQYSEHHYLIPLVTKVSMAGTCIGLEHY